MKLVILGNGFDLHHDYKTSFSHFRNHLKNSIDPIDKKLISDVDTVLKSQSVNIEEGILWNDFEKIIGKIMEKGSLVSVDNIELLSLTEKFTERFYVYLQVELQNITTIKNDKIEKELSNASLIFTFNYTNCYLPYMKEKKIDTFHIHGELNDQNLPLIGFFYPGINAIDYEIDFLKRFKDKAFHKPALAYKQNELNLDNEIRNFIKKWQSKFSEVVIIGYSFGDSDFHIYNILNSIILSQDKNEHVPASKEKNIPIVKFKFFNYNNKETNKLIEKIKKNLLLKYKRRSFVNITGNGFSSSKKEIIQFELLDY